MSIELIAAVIFVISGGASGACVAKAYHTPRSLRDRESVGEQLRHAFPPVTGDARIAALLAELDRIPD